MYSERTCREFELVDGLPEVVLREEQDNGEQHHAEDEHGFPQVCPPLVLVLAYPRHSETEVSEFGVGGVYYRAYSFIFPPIIKSKIDIGRTRPGNFP